MISFKIVMTYGIVAAALLSGCVEAADEMDKKTELGRPVRVAKVQNEEVIETIDLLGIVHPEEIITYAPKQAGKIQSINYVEGEVVEEGEALFSMESTDQIRVFDSAKILKEQTKEQLNKAEKLEIYEFENHERMKLLFSEGTISQVQYDTSLLKYESAVIDVNSAKKTLEQSNIKFESSMNNLNESTVYASSDGLISKVLSDEQKYIAGGQPVVMVRSTGLRVVAGVTEVELPSIKVGDTVTIVGEFDSFTAQVERVSTVPDRETRLFEVEININDENTDSFEIGSVVKVVKNVQKNYGFLLPVSCVQSDETNFVYLSQGNLAVKKTVEITKLFDNQMLISGISDGELVVIEGMYGIEEKDALIILEGE